MGTRTFLESEVTNTKARHDLYEKVSSFLFYDFSKFSDFCDLLLFKPSNLAQVLPGLLVGLYFFLISYTR